MARHSSDKRSGELPLNRRRFLTQASGGLGSVALASLLAGDNRLLASDATPLRPTIAADAPTRARAPHFAPKPSAS